MESLSHPQNMRRRPSIQLWDNTGESCAVPTDQGVRLHDRDRGSPIDQSCEHDEGDPRRIIGTAGFDPALCIERQLLPEKEIFGRQLRPRLKAERHEPERVDQQAYSGPPDDRRGRVFPHAKACHKLPCLGLFTPHRNLENSGSDRIIADHRRHASATKPSKRPSLDCFRKCGWRLERTSVHLRLPF